VAWTRSRSGGREHARPNTGGVAAEHATKILTIAGTGIVVVIAFLALTSVGHVVAAATQHFMLFYAGVFALIALCASVGLGLVATNRTFLSPARRVFIQSAHRAASFGAVTFLIVHIVTEILAQRVHVIDAVIPFLSPFRTFYLGLGTIASDLIILLVVTGIMRGRFNASGKAWRWRAMHYTSYASFIFGVWHSLLGGRPAKPYVDWSYGVVVALVLLGLAVRVLSNSLKPKESLSGPPVPESAPSASAPLRAAAMAAQLSFARGGHGTVLGASTGGQPMLTAPVITGTALPADAAQPAGQPFYEPEYEGPQRYLGASRGLGTGPQPRAATGPIQRHTGPIPRHTGPIPRSTGPIPRHTGPIPRSTGPIPRIPVDSWADDIDTTPVPPYHSGPQPRVPSGTWPADRRGPLPPHPGGLFPGHPSGPMPRAATGPMPHAATGPQPRIPSGPWPADGSGPLPSYPGGPYLGQPSGPMPRAATGPMPRAATGPMPRAATGPMPRAATGPMPRMAASPVPRAEAVPPGRFDDGSAGRRPSVWDDPADDGGWYPAKPQWEDGPWGGGFPEPDPDLRYREPGPGMPGYPRSRDQRYGGDQRW
jgi:hypothetical protein